MAGNTYAVVFTGRLVDGATPEQVKGNFAQLFKVDAAKVAPMFTGKPVAIKKGLDEVTARKYQQALRQAGAVCELIDLADRPAAGTQTAPAPAAEEPRPPQAPAPNDVAEPGSSVPALSATLAEAGALLKEPDQVQPLQVETSHLSLGEVGETLVEPEATAELQVDISALSMAEVGVQLVPSSTVEAPKIDISALSLAEP